ncbi:YcaO-like family protein [Natronoglycomyces albus]|uniref:YcaO-like family protein n=1 Tax=Natronoglycomyces albus TaxID=2811108 RepID=A0A895XJU1_9ACTN|nr:YcaO-like family protein [Natronoglycomyces albus]QSB04082.1 YcaO-like family protein [Natronoglycomyces albus]
MHTLTQSVHPLGVVSDVRFSLAGRGLDRVRMAHARAGNTHIGHHGVTETHGHTILSGTGRLLDDAQLARHIAIAEAYERYAGSFPTAELVRARASDLPGRVFDHSRLARCTTSEYAHPDNPFVPFDPAAQIRWRRGVDLYTNEPTWLPAVLTGYGIHAEPNERICFQISTGHAVHSDPVRALLSGLMEVIERDAIALTWLEKLPLPPVHHSAYSAHVRYLLEAGRRRFLTTHLFDATTDIGVPTVYVLQQSAHDRQGRNLVGASTGRSLAEAAEKALIEVFTIRQLLHSTAPDQVDATWNDIMDGARYMAQPQRGVAFEFLTDGLDQRLVIEPGPGLPEDPLTALRQILSRLRELNMAAYCADLTTAELRRVGLCAVAVIVPDLQPMSLHPRSQFRAHPRLAEACARMGYPALSEKEQNSWPQPFA